MRKPTKRNVLNNSASIVHSILSRLVHRDDYIIFEARKLWESLKPVTFYAQESEIAEFLDGVIFIKTNNSVIKNEIMLKKDEIKGLINVYLHSKLSNDNYPVKRVIVK